jgi:hypothetical protein
VVDRHQARDISRRDDFGEIMQQHDGAAPHVLDLILLDLISRDRDRAPLAMAGRDHYV